jgi:predicted dienelactone hydrolase
MFVLAGCGDDAETTQGPVPDPRGYALDADGPFGVGYRTFEHDYTTPAGPRTIEIDIWYPSEAPAGENPVYELLFTDDDVFVDAPVARSPFAAGFPVLVHSHGYQGFPGNSSDLMHHFASHGFIAIAPGHTENTLHDTMEPIPTRQYYERALDIRAALDVLAGLPAGDPLAGRADMERVAMSGHSFGVFTCWVSAGAAFDMQRLSDACLGGELLSEDCDEDELAHFADDLSEPRIKVSIPMAGGPEEKFFGTSGYDAIDVPVLLMTGSADPRGADALFDLVSDDLDFSWIDIEGGCHQAFGLGGCPDLTDDVGFPIINAYALAFARRYAMDDDDPRVLAIVGGDDTRSERVTLQQK